LAFSVQSTKPSLRERPDHFFSTFQKPEESLEKHLYLSGNRYLVEEELGRSFFPTLGEYNGFPGLAKTLFNIDMVRERVSDVNTVTAMNTNCLLYQGKFYCLNEGSTPLECRILPDGRLTRVGFESFGGVLDYPISAHPRVDAKGDLLFHSYTTNPDLMKKQGNMKFGRFSASTGQVESYFVPTTEKYTTFVHNLLFTENHVIIYDCSVHFDPKAMFMGGSFFRNNEDYNLRFGVFPKTATSREEVQWFDTGTAGAIIHPLNSWEDKDGTLVIWSPFCKDPDLDLDNPDFLNKFEMKEFRLDLSKGTIAQEVIDDSTNIEFCNTPVFGRFTRFGYAAIQDESTLGEGSFAGFTVWDMEKRKLHASVRYDSKEAGGEVVVIPRAGRDDCYIGVYLHNIEEDQSYFAVYDGTTTELIVRLKMPHRVPYGFHGVWLSEEELQSHFDHHEAPAAEVPAL
jgi:9-cis-epoxycarotenoid dioxygenase